MSLRIFISVCLFSVLGLSTAAQAVEPPSFIAFESGSVRPLALTADGNRLLVTNTPNGSIELYDIVDDGRLVHSESIAVGLEPVAIAVHGEQAWVVNHLSDSISIVDLKALTVIRTLLVGDEPRDIVFANNRAFVTTAHRGQHRTHPSVRNAFDRGDGDPLLHTPGVGRADLWIFDAQDLGDGVGGTPIKILEMFGDTPRALAVSGDGGTVYAAVFHSGNQTSVVHESVMCRGFEDTPRGSYGTGERRRGDQACVAGNIPRRDAAQSPNGLSGGRLPSGRPLPSDNQAGEQQPWTSMIVKYDNQSQQWLDSRGLNFSNGIRFTLPDKDVFAIDAQRLEVIESFSHVGTTLFNMAINPVSGKIYVSNTDANNHIRFEGPGVHGNSTVQGNIAKAQITVIDPISREVKPRHLNRHIDYRQLKASAEIKQHSVSTPMQMQVSRDGTRLYVAALGSNKIAVYNTSELEDDRLWDNQATEFDPVQASSKHFVVDAGPQGVLLKESLGDGSRQLYVLSRFDNSIKVLDANDGREQQRLAMFNPEPASLTQGRFMLYDADRTSSNGESSCASCHVFGDMDHLAWNLGNPDSNNAINSNPFPIENIFNLGCDFIGPSDDSCLLTSIVNGTGNSREFSSLKGPMTTQTMRGMSTHGHLHWRGDRISGYFGSDVDLKNPDTRDMEALDEKHSFKNFIVAFEGLLGLDVELESVQSTSKARVVIELENDVDKFADFMLQVQLPPNPLRGLDNQLSPSAQLGESFFDGRRRSDGLDRDYASNGPQADGKTCEDCHTHDPSKGFFGTDGKVGSGGEILILKVPHFRNLYQKLGMFGLPDREGFLPSFTARHQGDQIRGFGFLHDGATDTLFNFLSGGVFDDGYKTCAQTRGGVPLWSGCDFNDGQNVGIPNDSVRKGLVDFMLEFDSDLAPIVGQQITLSQTSSEDMKARVVLLEGRAATPFSSKILGGDVTECDLVVRGRVGGEKRGYLFDRHRNLYISDRSAEPPLTVAQMSVLSEVDQNYLTFTCVPPGSGVRMGLDRDLDGVLNRDQ